MLYSEDGELMPLTFADPGVENIIKKIGGNSEVRAHLENLGFVVGGKQNYDLMEVQYENSERSKNRRNRKSCKT